MYLIKSKNGTFSPVDNTDYEENKKIAPGTVVKVSQARNYKFLKKMFALFKLAHSSQDRIEKFEPFRKILILKAGYYYEVPNKDGEPYYIPQSLSYSEMSAETFEKVFNDVLDVVAKEIQTAPEQIRRELEGFY